MSSTLPLFRSSALPLFHFCALMLTMLFAGVASAQHAPPAFGLQAPPASCPNADPLYTCVPSAQITSYSPLCCGPNCHLEYCFTTQQTGGQPNCTFWYNAIPVAISLGNPGNGPVTVYSEYRPVTNGVIGVASQPDPAIINYIGTNPTVSVNSPTGILSDPNGWTEPNGPNGCTYEPTSNNGVVIVRSLMNSSSPSIQTYSIVNTGLMP